MTGIIQEWLRSVAVSAFLVAAARTLMPEGSARRIGAFTGGLILMAALIQPLARAGGRWEAPDFADYEEAIIRRQAELREQEQEEFQKRVEERAQALITEKAEELGERVSVRVTARMDGDIPLPWSVETEGKYSPALEAWIASELGIPPERQKWTA